MGKVMKIGSGLRLALFGGLLAGCSIFSDQGATRPEISPAPDSGAEAAYTRGKRLHLAGRYGEAQQAYFAALTIDPDHAGAKNGIAALLGASGDLDRAIAILIELSASHPASHVYVNLGHAYQLKGRDFDARAAYQLAVDLDPSNESASRRLQAIDDKLQAMAEATAVMVEQPPEAHVPAQAEIVSIGSSVYAMRYPATPQAIAVTPQPKADTPMPVPPLPAPQAVALVAPQPTMQVGAKHLRSLPIELVNANGVNGLARELRALLPSDEWRVVRTCNHDNFGVSATRIEYVPMHRDEATHFAEDLGINARLRANSELQGPRLRIILGRDCKNFEQLKQKLASTRPLAAS